MTTSISIVIATHNGAATLPAVLKGYQEQSRRARDWELIIIDNGSTDETREVVGTFRNDLPLHLLSHQTPGKNRALNLGLSKATGDILVFSDDDAIPEHRWLDRIADLAAEKKDYDIFGGRVDPRWPSQPPHWIHDIDVGAVYVITPDEATTGPSPNGANIWGPNMAVRRRVFEAGVRFDEQLGPSADNPQYRMGSETEFVERMCNDGLQCWYCDDWRVEHIIRPEQFEKTWVLKRAFRSGRGAFRRGNTPPRLIGRTPRWMLSQLVITYLKFWRAALLNRADTRFSTEYKLEFLKGLIHEARAFSAERSHSENPLEV